jgi:hypothetical protein
MYKALPSIAIFFLIIYDNSNFAFLHEVGIMIIFDSNELNNIQLVIVVEYFSLRQSFPLKSD